MRMKLGPPTTNFGEIMNCVFEGSCVKAFGKAIHALSRIGDELWLDPMVKGLALRSVNSAHSAYACFLFSPLFFQKYSLESASRCKLVMKSVLPLFRSLTSNKRNLEQCQISINIPSDRVIIRFFCRHGRKGNILYHDLVAGITKTHNLHFQESETLQAVFDTHLCPNVLKAPARLLGDMVIHFPVSQEEITLSMTPQSVSLRNYYEGGDDYMKKMCTQMCLHPDEFDYFQVGVDSDITFCLKELRSHIAFLYRFTLVLQESELPCCFESLECHSHLKAQRLCEAVHKKIKPVYFSVEDKVLEATVVLATLIDSENRTPSQSSETPIPTTPRCEGAAALPTGLCSSNKAQIVPDLMELIPSSQGSPIINPDPLLQRLLHINSPSKLRGSATSTPTSTTVCSLLFGALSSEQDDDGGARFPVLACYSDEEDSEDYLRSHLL